MTNNVADSASPSIVWTGTEYGIAWVDSRDSNSEIYFTRISAEGLKLGEDLRITYAPDSSDSSQLVWTGSEYGVVWTDWRSGYISIYFVRISASGNKMGDDVHITTANSNDFSMDPFLVWTGSEYAIIWTDVSDYPSLEINFVRLDNLGIKIGNNIRVTNSLGDKQSPKLAWTGTEYGASWGNYSNQELYFTRLNSTGNKIGNEVIIANSISNISLIWTGTNYGLFWGGANQYGHVTQHFTQVDENGNRMGADLALSDIGFVSWTGTNYGIAWSGPRGSQSEIYFARFSEDGSMLNSAVRFTHDKGYSNNPSIVWNGAGFGLSWHDNRDGNNEIYFALLSSTGVKIGDIGNRLTTSSDQSYSPSLSLTYWTPGSATPEYLIGWQDNRDGNNDIYTQRLDNSGDRIGSEVRITSDSANSMRPSVSSPGISWYDDRDGNNEIYLALLDYTGQKIGSDHRITNDPWDSKNPSMVLFNGPFAVSWQDNRDGNYNIYLARISPSSGDKVGNDIRITDDSSDSLNPKLMMKSGTGNPYCVVWQDNRDGNWEIYLAFLAYMGTKVGNDIQLTNDPGESGNPSLAWNGSEFGVAWEDNRDGNFEIYFTQFDTTGAKTIVDTRITFDSGASRNPSLFWTGFQYGISWNDYRNGNDDIYFAQISDTGSKLGSDISISNYPGTSMAPSLVWNGNAHNYAIAWQDDRDGSNQIYFTKMGCCNDDDDGDGYYPINSICSIGYDCDDTDFYIHPGVDEITCDGKDQNCNGMHDDAPDQDGDGATLCLENLMGTSDQNSDSDGDGMPDGWEINHLIFTSGDPLVPCLDPTVDDSLLDYDNDGLDNWEEYQDDTDPCDADTDGDLMPDGWEVSYSSCGLDPLDDDDALEDPDSDGLENVHEYFNNWDDNLSNPCANGKPLRGRQGIGYFSDSDGTCQFSAIDFFAIIYALCGQPQSYTDVYPHDYLVQDLDGSNGPSGGDMDMALSMLSNNIRTPGGWPISLSQLEPSSSPTVSLGDTVAIKVRLKTNYNLQRPGFGVVFSVLSGSATLYGGEGAATGYSTGSRYDLTNINGDARMVLKVTGTGTITVKVELPAANPAYDLMSGSTVTLSPDVEITGI